MAGWKISARLKPGDIPDLRHLHPVMLTAFFGRTEPCDFDGHPSEALEAFEEDTKWGAKTAANKGSFISAAGFAAFGAISSWERGIVEIKSMWAARAAANEWEEDLFFTSTNPPFQNRVGRGTLRAKCIGPSGANPRALKDDKV